MAKSRSLLSIILICLTKELLRLGSADKLFPEKTAKHIRPLSPCVTRNGQDGVCLHKNHCPSHFEKHNLQCFSPTGRRLVCCPHFHYRLPQEATDCGIRPKPNFLKPKEMVAKAIVGGEESVPLTWPWLTAIYEDQIFICGGALIGNRCIITAAHCFESMNPDPSQFFVRLGEHSLSDDGIGEYPEEYMADKITIHPKYSQAHSDYDLAIIHLNEAARETPICLPRPGHRHTDLVNKTAVVAGWGTKVFDPTFRAPFSSVLQEVTIPILHSNFCHTHYKDVPSFGKAFVEGVDRKYLCAGQVSGGKDACQGDSGGPLMAELEPNRWSLIGIVCIGFGCGLKGYPGIYTKVTHFQAWIEKTCGKR